MAITAATGVLMAGITSVELVARGGHGFNSTAFREGTSTFRGVLSQNVSGERIIDAAGRTHRVQINADDAYWITVADAVDLIKTIRDGTERHIPFNPLGADYTTYGHPIARDSAAGTRTKRHSALNHRSARRIPDTVRPLEPDGESRLTWERSADTNGERSWGPFTVGASSSVAAVVREGQVSSAAAPVSETAPAS